jgi:PRTRC genetic system protein F
VIANAIALPQLQASIPSQYRVRGASALATPLAVAAIEAGMVGNDMLNAIGATEQRIVENSLTVWWQHLQELYPLRHFKWNLHVQELLDYRGKQIEGGNEPVAWFCITNAGGADDMPRFTLFRRTLELEALLPGFGQAVLAVLLQACLRLPDGLNPWRAFEWAEWLWWSETVNDEELLEEARINNGYATIAEAAADLDIMTRARFHENVPQWVTSPSQVATKEAISAAAITPFSKAVIAACDAISELACDKEFTLRTSEVGNYRTCRECVTGSMVLLWDVNDVIGQVIDEAIEMAYGSGEYIEFIDSQPVAMTAGALRRYKKRTEQIMQMAILTERLLDLIGDPL